MRQETYLSADNQRNYQPYMTEYIVKNQLIKDGNFVLLDVGASGGISSYWKAIGKYLSGFGFDPLVKECERLNLVNTNSEFSYVPCYIIAENKEVDSYKEKASWYDRTASFKYLEIQKTDYFKEVFNSGEEVVLAKNKFSLDHFCFKKGIMSVDFIKVDTDGYDYRALRGAENLLSQEPTLGALVESNYNGDNHPHSNCFRNIDSFLASKKFKIFNLSVNRYSKMGLPEKFLYTIPAQNTSGQVSCGDFLYLRDFVEMKKNGTEVPSCQVIKMACIQEIFGLPDCAAELLLTFRDQLTPVINIDQCLDLLTKDMNLYSSYKEHMFEFRNNPKAFYPTC